MSGSLMSATSTKEMKQLATIRFEGIDQYLAALQRVYGQSEETAKRALYDGAGIVANQIKSALGGIQTSDPDQWYEGQRPGPTPAEKQALIGGFGLAHMDTKNGYISTKAGFKGQAEKTTVATIARQVESGTSWMRKQPVIRQAANAAKGAAEAAMRKTLDEEIQKLMS